VGETVTIMISPNPIFPEQKDILTTICLLIMNGERYNQIQDSEG